MADYTRIEAVAVCSKPKEDNDAWDPEGICKTFSVSRRAGGAAKAGDAPPEPTRNAFLIGKSFVPTTKEKVPAGTLTVAVVFRCWVVKHSKTEHVLLCQSVSRGVVRPPECSD